MQRRVYLIGVFAAVAIVFGGSLLYGAQRFDRSGPLGTDRTLVIPRGAGLNAISRQLANEGIIESAKLFQLGVRILGSSRDLKAGEYGFPAGVSMRQAYAILKSGETVDRWITLAEGLTSTEVVVLLAAAEGLVGEVSEVPAEGTLLPETYHYSFGDDRTALVSRMEASLEETLAELWPNRAEGLPIDTPEEAVILASIVEKETGVAEERPLVASVFVNRLRRRMRLQSDPTVAYGITQGERELGRPLTYRDLDTPSAYNTYLNRGLPPGPIANPGRASLEAVLNPAESPYLYFVADGTGGHAFSKTLTEHNRNVAKWRKFQREQRRKRRSKN
ncbi:MAG: endolytic transglycosylase MltG [Kiloniellales bacterium]|nr:endolytic transglycosylase MltG [Kiloniellales bacterium]